MSNNAIINKEKVCELVRNILDDIECKDYDELKDIRAENDFAVSIFKHAKISQYDDTVLGMTITNFIIDFLLEQSDITFSIEVIRKDVESFVNQNYIQLMGIE